MRINSDIQYKSSHMLLFHVEDILGLAQIRADKFTKNEANFSIKNAIDEVISMQHY